MAGGPQKLWLHALRDGKYVTGAPMASLPFSVGSKASAGLRLEDDEVSSVEGRVVLGPDGTPEYLGRKGGQRVPLSPGVHLRVGPFMVAVTAAPEAGGGAGAGGALERVVDLLPRLWDEEAGRPDLGALLEVLKETFEARWAAVIHLPEEGDAAEAPKVLAEVGSRAAGAGLSRTVLARVDAAEGPVLVEANLDDQPGGPIMSIPMEVRSVLAAPLMHRGVREGLVYLESPQAKKVFSDAERATLVAITGLVAMHLDSLAEASLLRARQARLGELYRQQLFGDAELQGIVGASPAMRNVMDQVKRAAPTDVTTLVLGESGTGKELVATALHRLSARAAGPFVAVNCTALPAELVESELFGHKKGAFSGATEDRLGRFQMADGGTLFLDELGDLPPAAQAKLLRALETRRVSRVGDGREEPVDVRVVAATKVDLVEAVQAGRFREDLYYRLKVFTITLPPLRERADDIPDLVEYLVPLLARGMGRRLGGLTGQAMEVLRCHSWPGNVRELRNVLEQAIVRAPGEWITAGALGLKIEAAEGGGSGGPEARYPDELDAARALWERTHISRILEDTKGDVALAAERLGIARSNLYKRIKLYHLDASSFRG